MSFARPTGVFSDPKRCFQRPKCHRIYVFCFCFNDCLFWLCQSIIFLLVCKSIQASIISEFFDNFFPNCKVCIGKTFKNNVLIKDPSGLVQCWQPTCFLWLGWDVLIFLNHMLFMFLTCMNVYVLSIIVKHHELASLQGWCGRSFIYHYHHYYQRWCLSPLLPSFV